MANFDIPLAAFILCASSIVSAISYDTIREMEHPRDLIVASIPEGRSHFQIRTKDGCAGTLRTTLEREGTTHLSLEGRLAFRGPALQDAAKFTMDALFNPLGQLTAGAMFLDVAGSTIKVVARDPNPITLRFDVKAGTTAYSLPFQIPGPLQLVPLDRRTARLEYAASAAPSESYAMVFAKPMSKYIADLELGVNATSEAEAAACDREPQTAVDISGIAGAAALMSGQIPPARLPQISKESAP